MNKNLIKLKRFIKKLTKNGILDWANDLKKTYPKAEVYLVGGVVRDILLGIKEIKDLDFVVRNVPILELEMFLSRLGWVELLGKNFGVLKFKPRKFLDNKNFYPLDIALPRSEFSFGTGGYRDFDVNFDASLDIKKDLSRRDFTINAFAVLISNKIQIIDEFNGLRDLKNKVIRCIGEAEERFNEDYTRILRGVRFACQLNFKIEKKTQQAIKDLAPELNRKNEQGDFVAPREVVAKEFLKALDKNPVYAMDLYNELGLFKVLIPEILAMQNCSQPKIYHSEGDVWKHTRIALQNYSSKKFKAFEKKLDKILPADSKLELIIALLLHDIGKPPTIQTPEKDGTDRIRFNDHDCVGAELTKKICQRLKLSAPEKIGIDCDRVAWIVRKHMMLVHGHPSEFRPTTIEKNFFNDAYPGSNLIKLAWLDISATHPEEYELKPDLVFALLKRIKDMQSLVKEKKRKSALPAPLLTGHEIMQILNIPAGKKVGKIKDQLREKQLSGEISTKKQAQEFIKTVDK